jgi:hypothetical protein
MGGEETIFLIDQEIENFYNEGVNEDPIIDKIVSILDEVELCDLDDFQAIAEIRDRLAKGAEETVFEDDSDYE